jgi:outer membrane receptor protein involved in Fe transport
MWESTVVPVGVTWTPSSSLSLKVTGFKSFSKNVVEADASNVLRNTGREKTSGMESELKVDIGKNHLQTNWTSQSAKRGDRASRMTPRQFGSLRLSRELPRSITCTNTLRYQGPQWQLDDKQGLKLPSSLVWDLRFAFKILSADLYFEAQNLNRERYADATALYTPASGSNQTLLEPQPERTFWAGITIRFEN